MCFSGVHGNTFPAVQYVPCRCGSMQARGHVVFDRYIDIHKSSVGQADARVSCLSADPVPKVRIFAFCSGIQTLQLPPWAADRSLTLLHWEIV